MEILLDADCVNGADAYTEYFKKDFKNSRRTLKIVDSLQNNEHDNDPAEEVNVSAFSCSL